jgi:hypothetical protein
MSGLERHAPDPGPDAGLEAAAQQAAATVDAYSAAERACGRAR